MMPSVTIVTINLNAWRLTAQCLESLERLHYPIGRVEIIVVDNGSTDDSVVQLQSRFPSIRLVKQDRNTGFAAACNTGARLGKGELVAFINNDMVPDREWLIELVRALQAGWRQGVRCVGSRIVRTDGKSIDFAGGTVNLVGHAWANGLDDLATEPKDVLFVSGGAMLLDRHLFLSLGGFDEDYFAFFEDVDLGWRLALAGYRVQYVPTSVTVHHHHATAKRFPSSQIQLLHERNAIWTLVKNLDDTNLAKILPMALTLAVQRGLILSRVEPSDFILGRGRPRRSYRVPPQAACQFLAVTEAMSALPELMTKRRMIQRSRVRKDEELLPLMGRFLHPSWIHPQYHRLQGLLVELMEPLGVSSHSPYMPRTIGLVFDGSPSELPALEASIAYWKALVGPERDVLALTAEKLPTYQDNLALIVTGIDVALARANVWEKVLYRPMIIEVEPTHGQELGRWLGTETDWLRMTSLVDQVICRTEEIRRRLSQMLAADRPELRERLEEELFVFPSEVISSTDAEVQRLRRFVSLPYTYSLQRILHPALRVHNVRSWPERIRYGIAILRTRGARALWREFVQFVQWLR